MCQNATLLELTRHGSYLDPWLFYFRHAGDLGNVIVDEDGNCSVEIKDSQISLNGAKSIIGRAMVVSSDCILILK